MAPSSYRQQPASLLVLHSQQKFQKLQDQSDMRLIPENNDPTGVDNEEQPPGGGGLSDLWKARYLLIAAAALYGTNFSLVKVLGDTMPVGVSSTLRFGLAAVVTLPWLVGDLRKEGAMTAAWLGFEVGLWNSIGYVAQAVGLETTPAAESAFICSLAVVVVPMLDFAVGKRLLSRQWIGAILAVVGVAFLELLGGDLSSQAITTGDMLSLVQPFAFGMGFWKMEQAMREHPGEASRMTAAQLMAVFFASTAYGLWAIDLPTLQSFPWAEWFTSGPVLFSLFWTGLITTALTIYMETLALETLSAAEATLIFSTEPLWGTAFAAGVMGEQLGPNVAVGAAFILAACAYSNLGMEGIGNLVKSIVPKHDEDEKPLSFSDLPAAVKKQWSGFSTGVATSLAALSLTPNMHKMDEINDSVEEMIAKFLDTFS
jgi:drug/metabolite transporter (DMT)-like permease